MDQSHHLLSYLFCFLGGCNDTLMKINGTRFIKKNKTKSDNILVECTECSWDSSSFDGNNDFVADFIPKDL